MDERGPKKKKYASKFHSTWCETFPFLTASHASKHHAYCKVCRANFSVEHGGKNDVTKHANNAKHKRAAEAQRGTPDIGTFIQGGVSEADQEVHVSIQKGFSIPPLQKCNDCCSPSKFHCPFCSPAFFKPTKRSKAQVHLVNHRRRAIYVGDYTIHRCGLECRERPHYHCLYCTATLIRKRDFISHLPLCRQTGRRRKLSLLQLGTQPKELIAPSLTLGESDIESDDDSDEITVISDSDESEEASSSQSATPIIPKSNEGTVERSTETDSSKWNQTAPTNIETPQDCDEYYFMSLVKMFKKLSPQKKASVRMKIERVLFEAEFD